MESRDIGEMYIDRLDPVLSRPLPSTSGFVPRYVWQSPGLGYAAPKRLSLRFGAFGTLRTSWVRRGKAGGLVGVIAQTCVRRVRAGQPCSKRAGHVPRESRPVPPAPSLEGHNVFMTSIGPAVGLTREKRDEMVVGLHESGLTFRRIAEIFDISKSQVQRIYRAATGEQLRLDREHHRREMFTDLRLLIESLRPWVHSDELPPEKDHVAGFLRAQRALALLPGLEEPKQTQVAGDTDIEIYNPQAMAFAMDVAAWAEAHGIMSGDAKHPPVPVSVLEARGVEVPSPGVRWYDDRSHERAGARSQGDAKVIGHIAPPVRDWRYVAEHPSDDD